MVKRFLILMLAVILFPVSGYSDSFEIGKWSVSASYAPIYEFNEHFLNEVFDNAVGPGIAGNTNLAGVSFDYKMGENVSISLGFSFAENSVHDAGESVTPRNDGGTNTNVWDINQDINFKAFTVSFLRKIGPRNKVVPYFGAGIGVCHYDGKVVGDDYRIVKTPFSTSIKDRYHDDTYSGFYPVLDARVGLGWNISEKFMLSVEERFVNGLGTFIQGKYVF